MECLVMYNLATSERILVRVMRATFNHGFRRDQDYSLITRDIRSPVRPVDAAAACEVVFQMTAASAMTTLKAGKLESLRAQETDGMVRLTGSRVGRAQQARLLGTGRLPVVMPSELLALRITEDAHAEDNRHHMAVFTQRFLVECRSGQTLHQDGQTHPVPPPDNDNRAALHLAQNLAAGGRLADKHYAHCGQIHSSGRCGRNLPQRHPTKEIPPSEARPGSAPTAIQRPGRHQGSGTPGEPGDRVDEAVARTGLPGDGGQNHLEAITQVSQDRRRRAHRLQRYLWPGCFWLCRVVSVSPDVHGIFRTCEVEFRPRNITERGKEYEPRTNLPMKIGVQRFGVLLPATTTPARPPGAMSRQSKTSRRPTRPNPHWRSSKSACNTWDQRQGGNKPGGARPSLAHSCAYADAPTPNAQWINTMTAAQVPTEIPQTQ